jgi:hypothetical protein
MGKIRLPFRSLRPIDSTHSFIANLRSSHFENLSKLVLRKTRRITSQQTQPNLGPQGPFPVRKRDPNCLAPNATRPRVGPGSVGQVLQFDQGRIGFSELKPEFGAPDAQCVLEPHLRAANLHVMRRRLAQSIANRQWGECPPRLARCQHHRSLELITSVR